MPKLDLSAAPIKTGSIYPPPYAAQMAGRSSLRLGELAGLTQFGVNIVTLEPGAVASLRHWHLREDEFAMVLSGTLVLIEDEGEFPMVAGDCAAWKAGVPNGHRFVNRSDQPARFLIVGSKAPAETATYSDVDLTLVIQDGKARFTYHDGSDWTGPRDLAPKGETE
ncbi:cupin domain-containing protein [Paracoccus yeei]|uniref:Cupin domain-containing protein n=1 Tax=Paracoccus yeei TaxID=147645 RepID=A0A1V0GPP4_9RHOB|nr:cupin domain-containing protein [Paracoccus yeei]ARC35811.1 cupin domain-containing protein [Paracoccus yeei]ATQ54385.1 cupin domain-containing protein [Paracoccus yeei]